MRLQAFIGMTSYGMPGSGKGEPKHTGDPSPESHENATVLAAGKLAAGLGCCEDHMSG